MGKLKTYVLYVNSAALALSILAGCIYWVTKDGYSTLWAVLSGVGSIPLLLYFSIRYYLNNMGWRGFFRCLAIPGTYVVLMAVINMLMNALFWSGGEASWSAMYLWAGIVLALAVILLANSIIAGWVKLFGAGKGGGLA